MSHHSYLWLIVFVFALVSSSASRGSAEDESDVRHLNSGKSDVALVSKEIEGLANRNPRPVDGKVVRFNDDFDWDEENRVWNVLKAMPPKTERLWPQLIKHLDDDRYCVTVETFGGSTEIWNVGDACRRLIADSLSEVYYRNLKPLTRRVYSKMRTPLVARDIKTLRKWCEDRRGLPVFELQIEMCKWAIGSLDDPELDITGFQRKEWIAAIEADADAVKESKKVAIAPVFAGERYLPIRRPKKGEKDVGDH